jgi:hypothetical protein
VLGWDRGGIRERDALRLGFLRGDFGAGLGALRRRWNDGRDGMCTRHGTRARVGTTDPPRLGARSGAWSGAGRLRNASAVENHSQRTCCWSRVAICCRVGRVVVRGAVEGVVRPDLQRRLGHEQVMRAQWALPTHRHRRDSGEQADSRRLDPAEFGAEPKSRRAKRPASSGRAGQQALRSIGAAGAAGGGRK